MVSRFFQSFFPKFSVCLEPFCSNFNVFLSLFCRNVVQRGNAEGYEEIIEEEIHKAIDEPSSHPQTAGGDRRLEVQVSRSNSMNYNNVWGFGKINILSTYSGLSWKIADEIREFLNTKF